jgi:hypothetical protein
MIALVLHASLSDKLLGSLKWNLRIQKVPIGPKLKTRVPTFCQHHRFWERVLVFRCCSGVHEELLVVLQT